MTKDRLGQVKNNFKIFVISLPFQTLFYLFEFVQLRQLCTYLVLFLPGFISWKKYNKYAWFLQNFHLSMRISWDPGSLDCLQYLGEVTLRERLSYSFLPIPKLQVTILVSTLYSWFYLSTLNVLKLTEKGKFKWNLYVKCSLG